MTNSASQQSETAPAVAAAQQQQQEEVAAAGANATSPSAHPVKLNANAKSFSPSPASAPPSKSPHNASTARPSNTNTPPYASTGRKAEMMSHNNNNNSNHGSAAPMMAFPPPPPGPFMNMPPPPPPPMHAPPPPHPQQQQQQQQQQQPGGPFHAGMMPPPPPPPPPPQAPLFAFNKMPPPPPPRGPPAMPNANAMQGNVHGQPYVAQPGGMAQGNNNNNMMAPNAPLFFANMLSQISAPPPPPQQQQQQQQQKPQQQQQPIFPNAQQQQQQQAQRQPGTEGMGFMSMPPPPANMLASYANMAPGGAAAGGQAPSMMMPFPFPTMPTMNPMMSMPLPMQPFFQTATATATMPPPPSSMPFAPQMMPPPPPPQMHPQTPQTPPQQQQQQQQQQQTTTQGRNGSNNNKTAAAVPVMAPPQLPLGFGAGPLLAPPPPPPPQSQSALAPNGAATQQGIAHIQPPPMTHILPPPPPIIPVPAPLLAAKISVGNASLAALHSKEPPKFSCVLLSGIPAVGKTTLGRELVSSLKTDGMGWAFFSGADVLSDGTGKRSLWDTTKEVFDALSTRLDELLEQQREHRNIKGLVIDKNLKGVEDLYYLSALLRARGIPFVGIIGMEADQDDVLIQRLGGGEELKEKLKYHRVLHARITSLAKLSGMYHYVDATRNKEEVIQALRTMVLGCCAQPPTRSIRTAHYEGTRCGSIVDRYSEYYGVMTKLFDCVNTRGLQFPGSGDFVAFSTRDMTDKGRLNRLKNHYGVRRKIDGQHYLLLYHHTKLYLIPPHMRAVLEFPLKAWQGCKLDAVSAFVLEGDLTKMAGKDGERERFFVYDALYWGETGSTGNNLLRMSWSQRQTFLATSLCGEEKAATTLHDAPCLIVHHDTYDLSKTVELLDSDAYPSDGIIFQPLQSSYRMEQVLVWRPPSRLTVDFRVGARCPELEAQLTPSATANHTNSDAAPGRPISPATNTPTTRWGSEANGGGSAAHDTAHHGTEPPARVYELEVYDKMEKRYMQYESATVEVRHADVVEGAIITCSLQEQSPRSWMFQRVRYDVLRPAFRHDLDELLEYGIIPRSKLVLWLVAEQIVTRPVAPVVPTAKATGAANHATHSLTAHGTSLFGTTPPRMASSTAAFLNSSSGGGTNSANVAPPPYAAALTSASGGTQNNSNTTTNTAAPAAATRLSAPTTVLLDRQARNITALTHSMAGLNISTSGGGVVSAAHASLTATPSAATTNATTPSAPVTTQTLQMSAFAAPRTTGAMETASASSASQLQLLASIVPSLHVIRGNRDEANARKATAAQHQQQHGQQQSAHVPRSAGIELPHPRHMDPQHNATTTRDTAQNNNNAASARPVPTHCAECHRKKEVEDLRLDKRDQKHYCYGCWAKSGWSFCAKCGEFKQGRHENRGRDKGTFYCHDCANQMRAERYEENKSRNSQQPQSSETSHADGTTPPGTTTTTTTTTTVPVTTVSKTKRETKTAATQDTKANNNNNKSEERVRDKAATAATIVDGEQKRTESVERGGRNKAETQGKQVTMKTVNALSKPRSQRRPEKPAEGTETEMNKAKSEESASRPKPAKKSTPTPPTTTTNTASNKVVDGSVEKEAEAVRETGNAGVPEVTQATPAPIVVTVKEEEKKEEKEVCTEAAAAEVKTTTNAATNVPTERAAEPTPQAPAAPEQSAPVVVVDETKSKSSTTATATTIMEEEKSLDDGFVTVSKATQYAMEVSTSQDKTQGLLEEEPTATAVAKPPASTKPPADKKNGGCMQQ